MLLQDFHILSHSKCVFDSYILVIQYSHTRDEFESLKRMFINLLELNSQQFEQLTKVLVEIHPFNNSLKIKVNLVYLQAVF